MLILAQPLTLINYHISKHQRWHFPCRITQWVIRCINKIIPQFEHITRHQHATHGLHNHLIFNQESLYSNEKSPIVPLQLPPLKSVIYNPLPIQRIKNAVS